MNLNYEETNELYSLLGPMIPQDSRFIYKLGHAINLVDECESGSSNSTVIIKAYEQVFVKFDFSPCWPNYLVEEVSNGHVTIDSAYNNFVTVEL